MRNRIGIIVVALLVLLVGALPVYAAPNTNRGRILNGSSYDGLRAVMSTGVGTGSPPAFSFATKSPDVFQYLAIQARPRESCISANIQHQRNVGSGTTTHVLQLGNFCTGGTYNGGPLTFDLTDATFRSSYVRTNTYNDTGTSFQDEVVDVRIILLNAGTNQWGFYIYNASTAAYDFKTSISGTVSQHDGWIDIGDGGYTQDPTMSCPTLYPMGIMEVRGVQKRSGGVWNWIGAGDISATFTDSWPCLTTNTWQEKLSLYHQVKIVPYGVSY